MQTFSLNGYSMAYRSEYFSYCQMKARCINEKHPQYKNYGGRGVIVCERWMKSFISFIEDMGRKPDVGYSIERIEVNGNYEPLNCKWATTKEQSNNKRTSIFLEYNGIRLTLTQWADKLGINRQTLHERLKRGYTTEQVLERAATKKQKHSIKRKYKKHEKVN